MSYDVHLDAHLGGPEPVEVYWRNHTSNTARMWRRAGCDIAEFHGRTAADLGQSLGGAIANIEADYATYEAMNPPNGWGSVDSCLDFLRGLRDACAQMPEAIVRVSR